MSACFRFEFALTCPLQASMVHDAAGRSLAAAMEYKAQKLEDRNSAQRCQDQGFQLVPMVVETLGGWGPAAQELFQLVAKATAEASGTDVSTATCQLYQGLAVKLQRAMPETFSPASRRPRPQAATTPRSLQPHVLRRRWCCCRQQPLAARPAALSTLFCITHSTGLIAGASACITITSYLFRVLLPLLPA